jgi:hypothetical protein
MWSFPLVFSDVKILFNYDYPCNKELALCTRVYVNPRRRMVFKEIQNKTVHSYVNNALTTQLIQYKMTL